MYYKIGTLAKRFGITPQALRFYEKQGLLLPARAGEGGDRRYQSRNLKWLYSIRRYHDLGYSLEETLELFSCQSPEELDTMAVQKEAETRRELELMERRLAAIRRQREDLARIGRLLHGCEVDNDETLDVLAKVAVSHALAGADMVAPSDMMDGHVAALRQALDGAGCQHVPIMAYSAKYASAFYGPFRAAAGSAPSFGDRRGYQMDPHNRKEALRECALDAAEGADILMVKPALSYLDVIRECADAFDQPMCAYSVSGEYAMVKAAAAAGLVDERRVMCEIAVAVFRAGADMLITYYAKELADAIRQGEIG